MRAVFANFSCGERKLKTSRYKTARGEISFGALVNTLDFRKVTFSCLNCWDLDKAATVVSKLGSINLVQLSILVYFYYSGSKIERRQCPFLTFGTFHFVTDFS